MEKIGLVTITYNAESVLTSFLECVWAQTYKNFILYIVDNESTDNTLSILKNQADARLEIIQNNTNLGVAAANNQGIKKALSDNCSQILLLNNDIEFNERLIETLYKIKKNRTKN